VPVIIPCGKPASKHSEALFTGFNEKSGEAIVRKAIAIFAKWMRPNRVEMLRGYAVSPELGNLYRYYGLSSLF
jgi:hypothetical protein